MRLKRIQDDFRVTELLRDEDDVLGPGDHTLHRVTKKGLTTFEAADVLARGAGVERDRIAYAGLKDKDGITGQFMTVEGGRPYRHKEPQLTITPIGSAKRALTSDDVEGNAFEVVVRDLTGDDMRRLRINLAQVREHGLPNYFDDQRFGCLRHGQGFVVRDLLRGDFEAALKALLTAPSPFGAEKVEAYKAGIARRWGDWGELRSYCRDRRGSSVFAHLAEHPGDFAGALERGIASREKTIHLFAYQSYLWNRALGLEVLRVVPEEDRVWLPGDAGPLPTWRTLSPEARAELESFELPLLGPGVELGDRARRHYEAVFRAEGFRMEDFLALDLSGFRPLAEPRAIGMDPEFLRAAPSEPDELHRKKQKMRVRFTLPRGRYATLVLKRLLAPTEAGARRPRLWISRHELIWPEDDGTVPSRLELEARRKAEREERERRERRGRRGDDRRGPRREGSWGERRDRGERGERGGRDDDRPGRGERRGPERDQRRGGTDDRRGPKRKGRGPGSPWQERERRPSR